MRGMYETIVAHILQQATNLMSTRHLRQQNKIGSLSIKELIQLGQHW
jgi:hypothetical protein